MAAELWACIVLGMGYHLPVSVLGKIDLHEIDRAPFLAAQSGFRLQLTHAVSVI